MLETRENFLLIARSLDRFFFVSRRVLEKLERETFPRTDWVSIPPRCFTTLLLPIFEKKFRSMVVFGLSYIYIKKNLRALWLFLVL